MKKAHLILGTVIATLCSNPIQAQTVISDSVAMGAGYGKAVYYDIRTGAEAWPQWTNGIFHTPPFRVTIVSA